MGLALGTGAVLLVVLGWELARPRLARAIARARLAWRLRMRAAPRGRYDPGRELRAEQRARALLRSCVDEREWAMYRDLGFLRVRGRAGARDNGRASEHDSEHDSERAGGRAGQPGYAYLIYPHKPIVAYVPATGELLNEYCVAFPDRTRPYGSERLPGADDVLAKWMALIADERRLVSAANMHLPGRQVDPERVRRDLARLARWERERAGERAAAFAPARHGEPYGERHGEPRARAQDSVRAA